MTRETKIGLLVGLAFIIVIGILLSDHLTQSTEPPQATLAIAGNSVRSTVNTPGSSTANPPITSVIPQQQQPVAPQQPVPTVTEVTPRQSPVQVDVGPGRGTQQQQQQQQQQTATNLLQHPPAPTPESDPANTSGSSQSEQVASNDSSSGNSTPPSLEVAGNSNENGGVNSALREAARQNHEELVPVGGNGNTTTTQPPQPTPQPTPPSQTRTTVAQQPPPQQQQQPNPRNSASPSSGSSTSPAPAGTTKYIAAEGDTVSKMASRFLGGNTKENRDLIVAANPSLQANPNKIIVGRSYNIPKPGTTIAQAPPPAANPTSSTGSTSRSTGTANNSGEIWYTIKEGDTLSRIAQEQCGTVGAVQAIIELNPETLSDANNIVVNTKIRLPSKQVATAN